MGMTEALDDGDGAKDVIIVGKIGVIEKIFQTLCNFSVPSEFL